MSPSVVTAKLTKTAPSNCDSLANCGKINFCSKRFSTRFSTVPVELALVSGVKLMRPITAKAMNAIFFIDCSKVAHAVPNFFGDEPTCHEASLVYVISIYLVVDAVVCGNNIPVMFGCLYDAQRPRFVTGRLHIF